MTPTIFNKHKMRPEDYASGEAIYCGRGSPWGNPYVIDKDGTRDEVCDKFDLNILPTLDVRVLKGANLICFCKHPGDKNPLRCHCDGILRKANALPYCVFCKKEHEGGDTCMGHYP